MPYLNELLFGFYPYVSGTVFLLGSLIRFDFGQYTWKSGSSQLLSGGRRFMLGNILFHAGILLLFLGHLFGLLTPPEIYHAMGVSTAAKQLMAMVAGGIFGAMCFVGMTILVHRRLFDARVRAAGSRMDLFILLLLYAQLLLGLVSIPISATHPDGAVMLLLAEWAQRIVSFRGGAAELIAGVHWVYKLHIVLGLTIFLVFPFTRLVHIWSAPVWYPGRRYQIVRLRQI